MIQSIGLALMWFGGVIVLGNLVPGEQRSAVQLGWFLFVAGYGLAHARTVRRRGPLVQGEDPYMA